MNIVVPAKQASYVANNLATTEAHRSPVLAAGKPNMAVFRGRGNTLAKPVSRSSRRSSGASRTATSATAASDLALCLDPVVMLQAMGLQADPAWVAERILGGLSTGEGLISAVRDPSAESKSVKGFPGQYERVIVDDGVEDKRLLVIEPEFARVLRVMSRQGNSLNAVLRDAWDRGNLNVMTKAPIQATGAHVCLIGHITVEELRRELSETDAANGFANRFIWLAVRRSKELPNPAPFTGTEVEQLAGELKETLAYARTVKLMHRTPEADELWAQIYHDLSAERDGLAGSILGRSEAQVLRLSMIYALLDHSSVVTPAHLQSALELWAYSERSVLHIFGDALGDPVADTIYAELKNSDSLSRTEISALFSKNMSSDRLAHALSLLQAKERATVRHESTDSGRPREVWTVVA